jgi:integrase
LLKTKNGDERDVPLSTKAVSLIESLAKAGERLFEGLTATSRDVLFRAARDKCGITSVTFHDARATAITRLSKKVDILTLARISGHRDLKSLQIYYRESAADIAKRLG